jgi:integrase
LAATDHLKLRYQTWYVRVAIPRKLWGAAGGKREFLRSLKTSDLHEANRLKHAHIAALQRTIKALARKQPDGLSEVWAKALSFRDAMERYKDNEDATTEFLTQIADEARAFEETHGEEAATSFVKVAQGEGTPLRDLIDTWLSENVDRITAQTAAQHRTVTSAFLRWAGEGLLVEDITRRKAGEFVSYLLIPASGLKRRTAGRYVSSLSSLWRWLMARGVATADNPWRGHEVGRKSKRGETQEGGQWSDAALQRLLSGSYTPQYTDTLLDLVRLALVTGARLDELCSLETRDIHRRDDGWWISIRAGKTAAAVRDVPIHHSAAHVLKARRKSADGFVFPGLIPGGPDKKRSWHVSKAFGRYTKRLKLGAERRNFHALRKSLTEAMEAAEVPESTTQLIIGHKRASLTYGHYSHGERVKLRRYINKLRYSTAVMRLIEGKSASHSTTRRRPQPSR